MKQELIGAIDVKQLALLGTVKNKNIKKVNANFFYANESLYIADKENNRILAIDEDHNIFLEIGDLQKNITNRSENYWDEELNKFLSQVDQAGNTSRKKKTRTSPRKKNRIKYSFKKVDKIVSDFDENIYISHYLEEEMEILKFNSSGKFLYRIGENGRDNPSFSGEISIIDMSVSKDNGLWLKYEDAGMVHVRYYNSFGKNRMYFREDKIEQSINAFLDKKENEQYRILEDILPLSESNKLAVIVNSYNKSNGKFKIHKKYFFQVSKDYEVDDYWTFDDKKLQVFNINIDNQILCFSYFAKEKTPLLKMYSSSGKIILKKKITLQKFNYQRVAVTLTQLGEIMGVFLKNNISYFVIWK